MKTYFSWTQGHLATTMLVALAVGLAGCGGKKQPPSPIAPITKEFEQTRKKGLTEYGVTTVGSRRQNTSTIDCMVFQQAQKLPAPTTLGGWSAMLDSSKLTVQLGCAPTVQALVAYETTRRALEQSWAQTVAQAPHATQALLKSSPMGQMVDRQIHDVVSEEMVCWSLDGLNDRAKQARSSVASLNRLCARNSAASTRAEQCANAWNVAVAQQTAMGERNSLSYLSELLARYRLAYLSCSPNAAQEYLQYHATVPKELFSGPAYRLAVPIDPILVCQMQEVRTKLSKSMSVDADREWARCATKWNLGTMYSMEQMPSLITGDMLRGTKGDWLFNPQKANENPQLWTFGECEHKMIASLRAQGLNLSSPQALKRHCARQKNATP